MYSPTLTIAAFNGPTDWDLSNEIMAILLENWTQVGSVWLRRHPEIPRLYDSRVRYYAEEEWEGPWLDPKTALLMGYADCKSLATWRCSEIRVRDGIPAKCELHRVLVPMEDGRVDDRMHVTVVDSYGRREDPSRRLGMR